MPAGSLTGFRAQGPHTDAVRGFVFDVATGKLNEVS